MSKKKKIFLTIVLGIAILIIISSINEPIKTNQELNRNYYINTSQDTYSFECNLKDKGGSLYCDDQEISGDFSQYDTTEVETDYFVNGSNGYTHFDVHKYGNGTFNIKLSFSIDSTLYKKQSFDPKEVNSKDNLQSTLSVRNKYLNKDMCSKTIKIEYTFSDEDIDLISKKNIEWKENEITGAEKAKKAQEECEIQGKWYREGTCKSEEEWNNEYQWRDAHQACKRYGHNGYAKTLTECYVGNEYKGPVEEEKKEETQKTETTESDKASRENMPDEKIDKAMDVCTGVFYSQTGISIIPGPQNFSDSYWSGEDYLQYINIIDRKKTKTHVVCKYNWNDDSAIITSWNKL